MILGLILALCSLPGICSNSGLLYPTSYLDRPQLGLSGEYLRLAATDGKSSNVSSIAEMPGYDPEFPFLQIPAEPDKPGLIHDTKLFLLYQVAIVGILYVMPESVSQWSTEDKNGNPTDKWKENVSNLRKDKDQWAINYIGHPYFGSVYYVRARHRGYDRQDSFWYAVVMSTIYEYGIEALFEPVSIQDLIFTPVGGSVLGEYFMIGREKMKRNIADKGYASVSDKILLFLTDPLGAINQKVDEMTGYKKKGDARLELYPVVAMSDSSLGSIELKGIQAFYRW